MSKMAEVLNEIKKLVDDTAKIELTSSKYSKIKELCNFTIDKEYKFEVKYKKGERIKPAPGFEYTSYTYRCEYTEFDVVKYYSKKFSDTKPGDSLLRYSETLENDFNVIKGKFKDNCNAIFMEIRNNLVNVADKIQDLQIQNNNVKQDIEESIKNLNGIISNFVVGPLSVPNLKNKSDKTKVPYKKINNAIEDLKKTETICNYAKIEFDNIDNFDPFNEKSKDNFKEEKYSLLKSMQEKIKFHWVSVDITNVFGEDDIDVYLKEEGYFKEAGSYYYSVPSINEVIKAYPTELYKGTVESEEELVKAVLENLYDAYEKGNKLIKNSKDINDKIKELSDEIVTEYGNLQNICNSYKNLEKAVKNNFKDKTGQEFSNRKITNVYKNLVNAVGAESAKKLLEKIIKKTGSKISADKVISVYKKYKKDKLENIKGTTDLGSGKTKSNSSRSTSVGIEATAAVVASSKKKNNKTSKGKTKKNKRNNIQSAAKKAEEKKMKLIKKIEQGAANKIKQVELDLEEKLAKIENEKETEIATIETERNRKIADLYDRASEKINNIDATDANAQEQIDKIKEQLINDIEAVNKEADAKIDQVMADTQAKIDKAKTEAQNQKMKIEAKCNKARERIEAKGTAKKTESIQELEAAAKETPKEKSVSKLGVESARENQEQSVQSLEESKADYNIGLTEKEEEIVTLSDEQDTSSAENSSVDAGEGNSYNDSNSENSSTINNSNNEQTIVYTQESNESNSSQSSSSSYNNYSSSNNSSSNNSNYVNKTPTPEVNETVETPAVPDVEEPTIIPDNTSNDDLMEVEISGDNLSEIIDTPKKSNNSSSTAIPIGLGVAAAGAAAVAGVRFVKNRNNNSDIDEEYDDENNNIDNYQSGSDDSAYMKDDYLGPSGSMYTDTDFQNDEISEIPDDNEYTDAGSLEEQLDDDFFEDKVLNDLG